MPRETRTFPLDQVVEQTGVPSQDWLLRKLRTGAVPGRRAGRVWRMTESDIAALVDYMAGEARSYAATQSIAESTAEPAPAPARTGSGLTARGRKRLARSADSA